MFNSNKLELKMHVRNVVRIFAGLFGTKKCSTEKDNVFFLEVTLF